MKTEIVDKMKNRERTSSKGGLVAAPSAQRARERWSRVPSPGWRVYEKRTKKRAGANDRGSGIKWNSARAEL